MLKIFKVPKRHLFYKTSYNNFKKIVFKNYFKKQLSNKVLTFPFKHNYHKGYITRTFLEVQSKYKSISLFLKITLHSLCY